MHYATLQLLCNRVFGSNTSFPNSKDIRGSFVSNDYAWHEWIWREIILVYMCVWFYIIVPSLVHGFLFGRRCSRIDRFTILFPQYVWHSGHLSHLNIIRARPKSFANDSWNNIVLKHVCEHEWNGMKQLLPVSGFTKVHNEHYAYDWDCLQDCDLLFFMFPISEMRDIV